MMIDIAIKSIFGFLLLKIIFSIFGWFSKDGKDSLYRNQLDKLFDKLHETSIYEIVRSTVIRYLIRLKETFPNKYTALIYFILFRSVITFFSLLG